MARGWVDFLGGPMGRFAPIGRARFWSPLRAVITVAWVFLAFAALAKANCAGGRPDENGVLRLNWDGNRQYTSFCYNDIVPLFGGRGLDQPGFVYDYSWVEGDLTRYMEYPVLAGIFQNVMGFISRNTYFLVDKFLPDVGWYFYLTAFVMSVIWVITARMVAELTGNRIWDTLLVVASPLLIMHAFTNWDIPSIFFLVAALLSARNRKFWLAGALIGLGTAFKMWPLFALGAYLVLAIRKRSWGPFLKMVFAAAVTWLAVNLPVYLRNPQAWGEFQRLNTERSWEWTTIYAVASRAVGWTGFDSGGGTPEILNTVTLLLFLGGCIFTAVIGLMAPRDPRVAEILFLTVAFFLLFNKVWSPQYSLWLVIPAVLALPHWRLLATWMTVDMLVWPILMWHMLGTENKGIPGEILNVVVLARDGLIIAMMVLVVQQMLGRRHDKVLEAHNGKDPLLTRPAEWEERKVPA
ncbi:glycosyltransferase family 87 protein [Corynebacterium qintianiae]|uniref:glycosyltransferase family 87 protein n=1 Tax=Corynebacterium qintianiae TaxID=2709392 RepID=UPI00197FC91F|nr:glycosyltransferase 87 family protein [Corynebacterium qintianiae]